MSLKSLAAPSPDCQAWFLDQKISPKNRSCYIDCAVAPVNMDNYMCRNQCEEMCTPIDCMNPSEDQCIFYSQCVESDTSCGESGYALNYGEKYCLRFLNNGEFSSKGRAWRTKTMLCLQQALVPILKSNKFPISCEDIEVKAFDTHVGCYTQDDASFCWLPSEDWKTIGFNIIDLKDVLSWNGIKQVSKIAFIKCREPLLKRLLGSSNFQPISRGMKIEQTESEVKDIKAKLKFIDELEQK
jgi:hypothetical protein